MHGFLEAMTPFGNESTAAGLMAPELARPLVHISANKDWKGVPVHHEGFGQHGPNAETPLKGNHAAGVGYQMAAKGLNYATGGNKTTSGLLDFYPEDLRELVGYMISTPIKQGSEFVATGKSIATGTAPDPTQIPIARRFFGADYDAADKARLGEEKHAITHPWESGKTAADVSKWEREEKARIREQMGTVRADKSLSDADRKQQIQDLMKSGESAGRTADHARSEISKRQSEQRKTDPPAPSPSSKWRIQITPSNPQWHPPPLNKDVYQGTDWRNAHYPGPPGTTN
jgi:hypothetical protein